MKPSDLFRPDNADLLVPELYRRAAAHYERCGMWRNAAECLANAGQKDRAAELCLHYGDYARAAPMLLSAGRRGEALECYRRWNSQVSERDTEARVKISLGISACLRLAENDSQEALAAYDEARRIIENEKDRPSLTAARCWEALGEFGIVTGRPDLIRLGYEMALRRLGAENNTERLRAARKYLPTLRANRFLTADLKVRIADWTSLEAEREQISGVRYPRRKYPLTASDENFREIFRLKGLQPLEYVKNEFKNNGDGTITDYATGLMWQKGGSDTLMSYEEARGYAEKQNDELFAGYDDWRLPTIDELTSLLEPEKQPNNLYIDLIFDEDQWWCWSSDQRDSGGAWGLYFIGIVNWGVDGYYARVVREQND